MHEISFQKFKLRKLQEFMSRSETFKEFYENLENFSEVWGSSGRSRELQENFEKGFRSFIRTSVFCRELKSSSENFKDAPKTSGNCQQI